MADNGETHLQCAVLRYLESKRATAADPAQIAAAVAAIKAGFKLDDAVVAKAAAGGPSLASLFAAHAGDLPALAAATPAAAAAGASSDDAITSSPLFQQFLKKVTDRGFFGTAAPGTEEHAAKMADVIATFKKRAGPAVAATTTGGAAAVAAAGAGTAAPAAASSTAAATGNDEEGAESLKTQGNAHVTAGRWSEAIECYSAAIAKAPTGKNVHIYYCNRAAAKTSAKDFEGAEEDARRAVAIDPSFAKGHVRLGTALQLAGRNAEAAAAYERALEVDPSNATAKDNLKKCQAAVASATVSTSSRGGGSAGRGGGASAAAAGGSPFGGLGGMGGMPDLSALGGMGGLAGMMNNPAMMQMAQGMMANPAMMQMAQSIMSNPSAMSSIMGMMGGAGGPGGGLGGMADMMAAMSGGGGGGGGRVTEPGDDEEEETGAGGGDDGGEEADDAAGTASAPGGSGMPDFSGLDSDPEIAALKADPEVVAIMEEVQRDGPMAMMRHMSNPKIQRVMNAMVSGMGK